VVNKIVVIGGSFGAVSALSTILSSLPSDFPAPILIVSHIGAHDSVLPEVLAQSSALPISHAQDIEHLIAGRALLAPPDAHLTVSQDGHIACARLLRGPKEHHTRPAVDPLFRSAAAEFGKNVIGVLLSGYLDDGAAGLQAIKDGGGVAIVQDPAEADAGEMPGNALARVEVDMTLRLREIPPALIELVREPIS
jgi:two-component system chemotaxis response regulator CheB